MKILNTYEVVLEIEGSNMRNFKTVYVVATNEILAKARAAKEGFVISVRYINECY